MVAMILYQTCQHVDCGNAIPPGRRRGAKYCGPSCTKDATRAAARRAGRVENCEYCQSAIPRPERPNSARYCSPKCQMQANAERSARINPEAKVDRTRQWRLDNPERHTANARRNHLASFGLTPEQFDIMLTGQGGRCAICKTDTAGGRGTWHIDHDHLIGVVRGLLCVGCNVGLGNFRDDLGRLEAAADYLRKHALGIREE